jgi:hypothetical protein
VFSPNCGSVTKCLENTELEVIHLCEAGGLIHLCEVGGSSKNKSERWYGFTSSTLFNISNNNDKIHSAVTMMEVQLLQSWHLEPACTATYVHNLVQLNCFPDYPKISRDDYLCKKILT